jgi:RimJ/RimL family protein N-acetyltransferase
MVGVEPVRPEWAQALAEGDAVFAERFGIPVEAGWSGFPEALPILFEATKTGSVTEWGPHLFFDDGALVGDGGWKGPPAEGAAELGYAVAPSRQRRGIATAVVRELVERARRAGLRAVTAHALAEENASAKVLQRRGFTKPRSSSIPMRAQSGAGNSRSDPRSARPNSTGCAATATETRPGRLNHG